jgi:valyl-tRNA synthetase
VESEAGAPGTMPPQYDAAATEPRWYAEWIRRGLFHPLPHEGGRPFCIVMPPPNVTGRLHIGHALTMGFQDVVIRRARMQGFVALWVPGTDHAGIATQVVVERELAKEGVSRREMGREAFVERVWQWREQYGGEILEQLKALGASADWERTRFTLDEGLSRAVRVAFVRMYDDGLIYRGERIINWCPKDRTALSDSEVEHEEVDGELVTFRYPLSDGSGHIDVATTRVETMLGDTGVAVHPDDSRYTALVGKTVRHTFDGRDLPIVADRAVEPAFGTGAVKVTPAHDPTDFEIGERTGLPRKNILNADATISDEAPEEFRGLDRYEARRVVAERLRALGWLVKEERPYPHPVGHCYRCGSEIEPWLSGEQWFVAVGRLKGPATDAVLDGRITFHPERWRKPYLDWLAGLRDWNISRQLWWGHRIPVWYCPDGHEFAAVEDPTACPVCGSQQIEQDPDVLDTWFSSQLWPFSTLGWPDHTEDLAFFHPTTVLITGYEILYLWVARMIMSGLYLTGEVPFRNVMIHGLVRDSIGRKMSKSLGNVVDPLDMIGRYGADATRFGLVRQASGAQDIPFGEANVEAARHFANKIWNAARLVLTAHRGGRPSLPPEEERTLSERWLLSRHQACLVEVDRAFEEYRFADAAQALQRFVWSDLCDWALEMEKGRFYEGSPGDRHGAASAVAWVLERSLRLLHPIMPFVTEEVWQRFSGGASGDGGSIVVAPWPDEHPEHHDPKAEEAFGLVQELVVQARRFRALVGTGPGYRLAAAESVRPVLEPLREPLERLTGALLSFAGDDGNAGERDRFVRLAVRGTEGRLYVPAEFDPAPALAARRKRLADVEAKLAQSEAKLGNESFLSRAKAEAVDRERTKHAELTAEAEAVRQQIQLLEQFGS